MPLVGSNPPVLAVVEYDRAANSHLFNTKSSRSYPLSTRSGGAYFLALYLPIYAFAGQKFGSCFNHIQGSSNTIFFTTQRINLPIKQDALAPSSEATIFGTRHRNVLAFRKILSNNNVNSFHMKPSRQRRERAVEKCIKTCFSRTSVT